MRFSTVICDAPWSITPMGIEPRDNVPMEDLIDIGFRLGNLTVEDVAYLTEHR